jgi:DNA-binding helix-turn-helix protein
MSLISKFNGNINVTGELIKEYRLKNNLSYEKLSAKLDLIGISIHKQSLYDIEHNKRTVKDYELFGLIHILKIDLNDLIKNIDSQF